MSSFSVVIKSFTVAVLAAIPGNSATPASVTIDTTKTYQMIEGLGGATAFYAGWVTAHPYKQEIFTNAFAGLNVSMLRLGDWYRYQSSLAGFDSAATEIVSNANRVLGHPVPVYMSSWAPPAFLKSNGQVGNGGSLVYTNGSFVYSNFARYWYDSIQAYKSNGVNLTWASMQNEPDFVASYDSCVFHTTEDTSTITNTTTIYTTNGTIITTNVTTTIVTNHFASYSKALDAVYQRLTNLPSPPKLLAPEVVHVAYNDLRNYAATLNSSSFYGVAHHLYGDGGATGDSFLSSISSATNVFPSKPRFMTEYGDVSDMIQCANLIHDSLVVEQVSGYNHWSLVWPGTGGGLIQIEDPFNSQSTWTNAPPGTATQSHGWWKAPAYWAMKHFSFFINPGYKRVSAVGNDSNLRGSGYLSPEGLRLVLVLINTNANVASTMNLNLGAFNVGSSSVYQTAGTNYYFQSLGPLTNAQVLPPRSLTTILLDKLVTVGLASNPRPADAATGVALNSQLSWTPGSNGLTHAIYLGVNSNAVALATNGSPEFQGVVSVTNFSPSLAAGLTYYWRVDEIAYSNTNHGSVWSFTTLPSVILPSPWQSQDSGAVGVSGTAYYSNGVFTVTGSGADIQGNADAFRFAYLTVNGDCTIVARVASVQNVNVWSKAGVMIRGSLAAGATNAFVALTPGNGVTWQYRSTATSGTIYNNTAALTAPYWVKLVRIGSVFTGYRSPDGTNWTQQGTATFTMAANTLVGLAVTSHNNSSPCTAVFDNVTAATWPALPGAPASLTATAGDMQVALNWAASSGASSYNLKRATSSGGPYTVVTNVTTTADNDTGLLDGTTYYYVVSALNIAGESNNSAEAGAMPQVPPNLSVSFASTNLVFSWPVGSAGFTLQSRTNLTLGNWENVTSPAPQMVGNQWQVTLSLDGSGFSTFYRLVK